MAITSIKTGSSFTNLIKYDNFLGPNAAYIPSSFESIATFTSDGGNAYIVFSSIPQTYKSLQLRWIARNNQGSDSGSVAEVIQLRLNDLAASDHAAHYITGNGTTVTATNSGANASTIDLKNGLARNLALSNTYAVGILDIHDYSSTTKNKTIRAITGLDQNTSGGSISLNSGAWFSTTAVTSIGLYSNNAFTFAGSFALYGIKG